MPGVQQFAALPVVLGVDLASGEPFVEQLLSVTAALGWSLFGAAVGDVAHPAWRARSVGVYRLWRDGGFAVGALLAGALADADGIPTAIWVVAVITAASGLIVAVRMYETHHSGTA